MAIDLHRISASMQELLPVDRFGLRELEEIRLILRGGSVIDWRRLHFRNRSEVDAFLRLAQLRPDEAADQARMREVLDEAVAFLRAEFRYRVAPEVANPREIHDIFLTASGVGEHRRLRRIACIVLKVMHTIFHTDAREHLFRTPISSRDFETLIDLRVRRCAEELLASQAPIIDFSGSVKSRASMITKLLAKRESVAAQIFDKVRYRIVTESWEDILPVLHYLTTHLFPFAFTVPAQTQNSLVPFNELFRRFEALERHLPNVQHGPDFDGNGVQRHAVNEYSGPTYRVLNFVADVPVRLDDHQAELNLRLPSEGPHIAFAPVEFQIVDQTTAEQNEKGDNAHAQYKRRQRTKVLRRLSKGLVVPRKSPGDDASNDVK